jgi:uncharacterized RDD family membrane protein YckC
MTGPDPSNPAPPDPAWGDPAAPTPPVTPPVPPPAGPPPAAGAPSAPGPASGLPAWTSQLTSTAPVAGPAGLYYADVPNRAIAYIIDAIILAIVNAIVGAILAAIGLNSFTVDLNATTIGGLLVYNPIVGLIQAVIFTAISGAYFVYLWTTMRGTVGQKVLGMQVGNAADGKTLTMEQAVKRWLALGAPFGIAQALNPLPGLGILIALAAFVWFIALLVTTAQSPTKQGLHDRYANTVVVKAARAVG